MPSQSYMWFNGTSPCELGQYCGGIYKLLCVCTGRCAGGECVCYIQYNSINPLQRTLSLHKVFEMSLNGVPNGKFLLALSDKHY